MRSLLADFLRVGGEPAHHRSHPVLEQDTSGVTARLGLQPSGRCPPCSQRVRHLPSKHKLPSDQPRSYEAPTASLLSVLQALVQTAPAAFNGPPPFLPGPAGTPAAKAPMTCVQNQAWATSHMSPRSSQAREDLPDPACLQGAQILPSVAWMPPDVQGGLQDLCS